MYSIIKIALLEGVYIHKQHLLIFLYTVRNYFLRQITQILPSYLIYFIFIL